jgi:hypothetical protein
MRLPDQKRPVLTVQDDNGNHKIVARFKSEEMMEVFMAIAEEFMRVPK